MKKSTGRKGESAILKEILDGLALRYPNGSFNRINNIPGFMNIKGKMIMRRPSSHSPNGISDIIGVLNSVYIAIEVKSEKAYRAISRFYSKVKHQVLSYQPRNDFERHALNQIRFLEGKRACGGIGFFTYSLEDTINKLDVEMKERIQ